MNPWQDLVVVGLIALAAVYLARVLWFRMTKRANACCNTCHRCPSSTEGERRQDAPLPLTIPTPAQNASDDKKLSPSTRNSRAD